jgi:hypothetical protein
MSLTITIPDDFAAVLGATDEERERRAREALALELYREGRISLRRMDRGGTGWFGRRLLGRGSVARAAWCSGQLVPG